MKEKTSLVFTGDIGFDRYFYGKWDDEDLISEEILEFLDKAESDYNKLIDFDAEYSKLCAEKE